MPSRVDAIQAEVVQALRKAGRPVHCTHTLRHGFPDIMTARLDGSLVLLELKAPDGELTPDETRWHSLWTGSPVYVVHNVAEAFSAVGIEIEEVPGGG